MNHEQALQAAREVDSDGGFFLSRQAVAEVVRAYLEALATTREATLSHDAADIVLSANTLLEDFGEVGA